VGVILLVVILGGFLIYNYFDSEEYRIKTAKNDCISSAQDQAIHISALKANDPYMCDQLSRTDYKKFCLAEITQDPVQCEGLQGVYYDFCMFPITKDKNHCLALEGEEYCEMKIQNSPEPCKELLTDDPRDIQACEAWARLDASFFQNQEFFKSKCNDFVDMQADGGVYI